MHACGGSHVPPASNRLCSLHPNAGEVCGKCGDPTQKALQATVASQQAMPDWSITMTDPPLKFAYAHNPAANTGWLPCV